MLRRAVPFVAFSLFVLPGCIVIELPSDLDLEFETENEWRGDRFDGGFEGGGSGRVQGDLGPVRDFDGTTRDVQASADESWSSVTVTAFDDDGRMGMLIIEIGADIRSIPSGTYTYSDDGTVNGPGEIGEVYVTGCSSTWDSDYDAGATDGVIIVDNDGDECDVDVEAELPDEYGVTATATGSFRLE